MKRHATAHWQGSLTEGTGSLDSQSGAFSGTGYSFKARFQDESGKSGTNPEELIAAAHAGCFAMQLSHMLAEAGHPADSLDAKAVVALEQEGAGFAIKSSAIKLDAKVPGMAQSEFETIANKAKEGCPVSKALGAIDITLDTTFSS